MVNVVSRSPFEYYPTVAPTGGGIASAFQAGALTTEQIETNRAAREREQALLPFKMQEYRTIDEMRRQQLELSRAAEARAAGAFGAAAANAPGAGMGVGATPPAGSGFIPAASDVYGLIAGFENFRPTPYEDMTMRNGQRVSAGLRLGYGSDTITRPDGTVVRVAPGAVITQADAERDLRRRVDTEFGPKAAATVGETWDTLPQPVKDALLSVTYNYGHLPEALLPAIRSGDPEQIARGIESLAGANSGINRNRRAAEANYIRRSLASPEGSASTGTATPPAGLAPPSFNLPAGALSGTTTMSTGGVPMTPPNPDIPAAGANESQFMVPGPSGMTPVAAPLDAQGRPVNQPVTTGTPQERAAAQRMQALREQQAEAARQRVLTEVATSAEGRAATDMMEQGRLLNNREMYARGLAQFNALAEAANARLVAENLQPAAAGAATPAPAPSVGTSQPMPTALGGSTPTLSAGGFSPVGAAGTQTPGILSPTLGMPQAPAATGLPAGVTVARPVVQTGEAPGARTPTAAASATSPAAERVRAEADRLPPRYGVFDRAEVARERDTLNQQMTALMNQRRIAIASRNASLLNEVDTALIAANRKSDMLSGMEAVASLDAGDPRPIADYFYRRTNGRLQLQQNPDNTYNVLDNGTVTQRNMSAAELARYARSDVDYRVRAVAEEQKRVQAERAGQFYKTQLEILKDVSQQRAAGDKETLVEAFKAEIKARTGQEPKMEIQNDRVYIFDPNNKRVLVGRTVNTGVDGQRLPNNQTRLQFDQAAFGIVPTAP